MKLMFLHPVDYGRKAEELLWRKVYYEVIQVIKTNKKVCFHLHTDPASPGPLRLSALELQVDSGHSVGVFFGIGTVGTLSCNDHNTCFMHILCQCLMVQGNV